MHEIEVGPRVGGKRLTRDHVFPKSRFYLGEKSEEWRVLNKVRCCRTCNGKKADMHPLDWLMVLKNEGGAVRLARRLVLLGMSEAVVEQVMLKRKKVRA